MMCSKKKSSDSFKLGLQGSMTECARQYHRQACVIEKLGLFHRICSLIFLCMFGLLHVIIFTADSMLHTNLAVISADSQTSFHKNSLVLNMNFTLIRSPAGPLISYILLLPKIIICGFIL